MERIARWLNFLITFVEYYGRGAGQSEMAAFFASDSWEHDYNRLSESQRDATQGGLFTVVGDDRSFYKKRLWEVGQQACKVPASYQPQIVAECAPQVEGFLSAELVSVDGDIRTMRVWIPPSTDTYRPTVAGSRYTHDLQVMLPEGEPMRVSLILFGGPRSGRAPDFVVINKDLEEKALKRHSWDGPHQQAFEFTYNPVAEAQRRLEQFVVQHNRCCCDESDDQTCLWFPDDTLLESGSCPRVFQRKGTAGGQCASSRLAVGCLRWRNCYQTHHESGKCEFTKDPAAYFHGGTCALDASTVKNPGLGGQTLDAMSEDSRCCHHWVSNKTKSYRWYPKDVLIDGQSCPRLYPVGEGSTDQCASGGGGMTCWADSSCTQTHFSLPSKCNAAPVFTGGACSTE